MTSERQPLSIVMQPVCVWSSPVFVATVLGLLRFLQVSCRCRHERCRTLVLELCRHSLLDEVDS
jgi:hypothetical protein